MTPDQILDGAAREIEKRGWDRKFYENSVTGAVCLMGACSKAGGAFWNVTASLTAEIEAQTGVDSIVKWNDKHCKDRDEAIYMLQAAAKRARANQDHEE